ncbi:MAG: Hsp20/alpha crystallin family protein [Candidatus Thermoplasmatota archaeon]|nr:Hsp20/alpha crystallin family protein [Candidatus Thermoplasmatota archaeon]
MAEEYHPGKYLAEITKKCRELTVSEMLRSADEVMRKNRLGFGHYLFDGVHAPKDKWTIPGALDYEVIKSDDGVEMLFKAGPFHKEELSVHVEEGSLDVEALHEEEDPKGRNARKVRVSKHVPVPFEFDLEDVEAKFEKEVLIVRIPKPTKPRRKVDIL